MSLPYVPADIIDEARDLRRQGHPVETLASRIGVKPDELAMLLGEPQWRQEPAANDDFDLFAVDRLEDVL